MPVHDRHEVQEAAFHWDVRDIRTPHLVRPGDGYVSEQIRIHLVLGMRLACSRLPVDRHQSHLPHQAPHALPANLMPFISQDVSHLSGAEKWQLHEQFIDATH